MTISDTRSTPADRTRSASPAAAAVLGALTDRGDTTAEELAGATGLGRSTVTKALAALAANHQVRRRAGGRDKGRRVADRWSLPTAAPEADQADQGGGTSAGGTDRPGDADRPGDRAEARLGRGQLRSMVAARLTAEPGVEFSPARLAGLLGRSAGAVGNALDQLSVERVVVQTGSSPRRYRAAAPSERA